MSVIEVLWKLGYDVLSFNDGIYKVQFSGERVQRCLEQEKNGESVYDFDLYAAYEIRVGEVGFNQLGNLYVEFLEVINDDGVIFDAYEYRNMQKHELY